ncbi:MAG TPA: aminotransferase class V-fold PLP-dependent enzyme [Longimicrobiales bacterium]
MTDSRPPLPGDPLELDAETMRRLGYRVVDLLVERISGLDREPAWRGIARAELEPRLREPAPEAPRDFDRILHRLAGDVVAYTARVDHPRFLAYVPGCPTWPGILGDFIAAGYNIFQGTWLASAGPSEVELVVLDWFKAWLGYPDEAAGVLVSGGSVANLTALACAREAVLGEDGRDAVLYLSAEAHSSVLRATRVLGFRRDQLRLLPVDEAFRLDPATVAAAVDEDARAGRRPFLLVANAGATSTGAIDPLPELADLCAERGLWFHVDGAYGGFAALTERGRALLRGIERADSITLDPHKWLYQPFEAGCLLVRRGHRLHEAFHILPDYLQDAAVAGAEVNFADRGVQLTRAARALKLWISIQYFGLAAFRQAVDNALDLALHAERVVEAAPELELLAPATLGIVCFRRRPAGVDDEAELERINAALVPRLLESGVGMISSTRLHGRYALRVCPMNHRTRPEDVERVLQWLATAEIDDVSGAARVGLGRGASPGPS